MTKIICISGRKQAGKNVCSNFMVGMTMMHLGIIRGSDGNKGEMALKQNGDLWISDIMGEAGTEGVFDITRTDDTFLEFANEYLFPYIKPYSFADVLKQTVCMDVLGLSKEACYGTDEQKNAPTHLRWEDMPGVTTNEALFNRIMKTIRKVTASDPEKFEDPHFKLVYHAPGPMSGREVMQYVGSDIFRRMYGLVWANATINKIKKEDTIIATITDCRFPNEVKAVQDNGGTVIRLTRDPFHDEHMSETALDPENYDWEQFDHIIDNTELSIDDQCAALYRICVEEGVMAPHPSFDASIEGDEDADVRSEDGSREKVSEATADTP